MRDKGIRAACSATIRASQGEPHQRQGSLMTGRGRGGGGHATAGGVDFQALTAAWLIVGMLAETECEPPWGWPRGLTVESVRSETGEAVDDIWVRTSEDARAYIRRNALSAPRKAATRSSARRSSRSPTNTGCATTVLTGRTPLVSMDAGAGPRVAG